MRKVYYSLLPLSVVAGVVATSQAGPVHSDLSHTPDERLPLG